MNDLRKQEKEIERENTSVVRMRKVKKKSKRKAGNRM